MLLAPPRNCPRCRGSMLTERDWYGSYSTCIACGYVHEWVSGPAIDLPSDDGPARQRRRQPSHGKLRL
jgi:hypothetical protein